VQSVEIQSEISAAKPTRADGKQIFANRVAVKVRDSKELTDVLPRSGDFSGCGSVRPARATGGNLKLLRLRNWAQHVFAADWTL
jgi:hypothetical protein